MEKIKKRTKRINKYKIETNKKKKVDSNENGY